MKKFLSGLLSVTILLSQGGCVKNIELPQIVTKDEIDVLKMSKSSNYEALYDGYTTLFSSDYDVILLDEEDEKKYPALKKSLSVLSAKTVDVVDADKKEIGDFAREVYNYDKENFYSEYTSNIHKNVKRSDSIIFSIEECYDQYSGGAHPNYWYSGVNFDTQSGKKLTLGEVVTGVENLPEIIRGELREKYGEETFFDLDSETFDKIIPENDSDWVIEYDKIVFYFSPYEIASYGAGLITAELFFSEYGEIINDRIEKVPDGYVINLTNSYNGTRVDLDRETEGVDEINITYSYDDYMCDGVEIIINSETYMHEDWFYDMEAYLVHLNENGKEKNYIYTVGYAENDYPTLTVFSITPDGVKLVETYNGTMFESRYFADSFVTDIFTDVEKFTLGTRMHFLGTYSPTKEYRVDFTTGRPVSEEEWYSVDSRVPHVTRVDLVVTMLKDNSQRTIESGEELMLIRTDGENYGDFVLESGEECRINVEYTQGTYFIDGMSEYEVFEELLYAG